MAFQPPKDHPQMPSKRAMLRSLALSARDVAKDPRPAGRTLKDKRLAVCYSCDQFVHNQQRCRACGCFMQGKAGFRGSKCPKGLWPE